MSNASENLSTFLKAHGIPTSNYSPKLGRMLVLEDDPKAYVEMLLSRPDSLSGAPLRFLREWMRDNA